MKLYQELASTVSARLNCIVAGNATWEDKHTERIETLVANYLPRGSGIDQYPTIDLDESTEERLVFHFGYHHMNENGFYDGWTEHILIVRPSLQFDIVLRITGKDRNQVKDYLYDIFDGTLRAEVTQ
jgi:hypothetical protein